MTTYNDILNQIDNLNPSEQSLLFEKLRQKFNTAFEIEDFSAQDLVESESEWQNYLNVNDKGKSLEEIELELFEVAIKSR
ncbi:MAG: hypothetical protein KA717_34490 [Woronichinia naegeliana WA131]|uniref:Uncharacterized protein n=1 Tax=Woronichinia naegeliana WA131 TaxID=2824559 RepID=A0A977KVB4_9CYAN|nr:MAG: hypothetical protein KA717_34490 [Woronichinia naegeliana WA131]